MADRPILFSGAMIRALLAGRKVQTRRILKPQPELLENGKWHVFNAGGGMVNVEMADVSSTAIDYLPIQEGDHLWVREAFSGPHDLTGILPRTWGTLSALGEANGQAAYEFWYWADGNPQEGDWTKPKPGIHMPRWVSRLTLTVTAVRVERLHCISADDAKAEGIYWSERFDGWTSGAGPDESCDYHGSRPERAFERLWCRINGDESWESNPWVMAVSFSVEHRNIGAPAREEVPA